MELNNILAASLILFTGLSAILALTSYLIYKIRKSVSVQPINNNQNKSYAYAYSQTQFENKQNIIKRTSKKFNQKRVQIVNRLKPNKFRVASEVSMQPLTADTAGMNFSKENDTTILQEFNGSNMYRMIYN